MKLSETARATEWLAQFEDDDRASARALLDSVKFVPGGEVVAGVRRMLEDFVSQGPDHVPAAVVPILSIEDMDGVPNNSRAPHAVVFEEFDPGQPIANDPGSEAYMAHLVAEIRKGSLASFLVPTPLSLTTMKSARSRTLLCITDYIGSGRQVLNYVETWYRHKTIKSWRSLGWLKIVVVAYASTTEGKKAVEDNPHVDELRVVEIAPGIERLRQNPDEGLEQLCRLYSNRGRLRRPLGYLDSAGLYASSYSIPNNLPAILIKRSNRWKPFFDNRSISAETSAEIEYQRPPADLPQRLLSVGQIKLAMGISAGEIDHRWHRYLAAMALLPTDEATLALDLDLDLPSLRVVLESLKRFGLVDASNRLTADGRRTLQVHRRRPRTSSGVLVANPLPYYPRYQK
ncbi:hypothetical protein ACHABQ_08490 [Nesterenkonia aurantiaca]|uniref:phosphoribosyltransferase-like protein n=1 Tax=Nesterenkonia aurantiaca TaxID=1436010 RepID=UPI003EE6A9D6